MTSSKRNMCRVHPTSCHATRNVEGETPQQKLGGNKSLISATRQIPQAPDPSPPLVMEMQLASG
jgi:hypothetical protein